MREREREEREREKEKEYCLINIFLFRIVGIASQFSFESMFKSSV